LNIPLVDLKAQYQSIKTEIDEAVQSVIDRAEFILGREVEAFEQEMAAYLGAKHAVGVASGTEALQLALIACGVEPGDEVITPPFTFIATAEATTQCGATPVFVDIDPSTYNLDAARIERAITKKTKAILPVHLYGHSCDIAPILQIANKYKLKVIEDCAQALGATYSGPPSPVPSPAPSAMSHEPGRHEPAPHPPSPVSGRRKVGSLGDAGCFSFFPSKILGAYGDGGLVATNDPEIAERLRMLRNHGSKERYYHLVPGFNSRLDSLQAAILRVKLRHVNAWIELRQEKAHLYREGLTRLDGIESPFVAPYARHVFNYYTIRLKAMTIDRNKLRDYLASKGIATAVYYPLSLHLQQVYHSLGHKHGDFPESELAQEQVLTLPMYPELREEQVKEIVGEIKSYLRAGDSK